MQVAQLPASKLGVPSFVSAPLSVPDVIAVVAGVRSTVNERDAGVASGQEEGRLVRVALGQELAGERGEGEADAGARE